MTPDFSNDEDLSALDPEARDTWERVFHPANPWEYEAWRTVTRNAFEAVRLAAEYAAVGIRRMSAADWVREGIGPAEAAELTRDGFDDAMGAVEEAEWRRQGFTPHVKR